MKTGPPAHPSQTGLDLEICSRTEETPRTVYHRLSAKILGPLRPQNPHFQRGNMFFPFPFLRRLRPTHWSIFPDQEDQSLSYIRPSRVKAESE